MNSTTVGGMRCGSSTQCSSRKAGLSRPACSPASLNAPHRLPQTPSVVARASTEGRSGDSNFMAGFVVGGVVFGTLGFLFAPQISKSLLGDDQRLRLPRFMEEEQNKDPEQTKQDLVDKIAKLNASIDEVAGKLKDNDKVEMQA